MIMMEVEVYIYMGRGLYDERVVRDGLDTELADDVSGANCACRLVSVG